MSHSGAELLILKTGSTLPALAARKGDFEDWIMAGLALPAACLRVIDVRREDIPLPPYETLGGVIITGSHAMVTEHASWSERLAAWLPELIARRIPTLGICYGHQLLAYALGGRVGDNPRGPEYGTVPLQLHAAATTDALLGALPQPIYVHVSHFQSVLALPPQATLLASSADDPHQAFSVGECTWGLQFHPEFDCEIVTTYIHEFAAALQARGVDPQARLTTCQETPQGTALLQRFGELTRLGRT